MVRTRFLKTFRCRLFQIGIGNDIGDRFLVQCGSQAPERAPQNSLPYGFAAGCPGPELALGYPRRRLHAVKWSEMKVKCLFLHFNPNNELKLEKRKLRVRHNMVTINRHGQDYAYFIPEDLIESFSKFGQRGYLGYLVNRPIPIKGTELELEHITVTQVN